VGDDDLEPITPSAALDIYLDERRGELASATIRDHEYRLRTFTDWLEDRGITNLNDLDIRTVHEWRVWKREDNGDRDPCNSTTMRGQVSTLKQFLYRVADIRGVPETLPDRIRVPYPSKDDRSDDTKISSERIKAIFEYLDKFEYASRKHVTLLLAWRVPARRGGLRALDLEDWDPEGRALEFRHRPSTGTPLKNGVTSERDVILKPWIAEVVQDYIEGPRTDVLDENGRKPLITTYQGRPHLSTIQGWCYDVTRPCEIGDGCPHDRVIEDCEATHVDRASKCPSSRSPHQVRTGSVTAHRTAGTPRAVVSDRGDASEDVLEQHYDKAGNRERARRRQKHIPDEI
jgi:site-specific recombinase XerD